MRTRENPKDIFANNQLQNGKVKLYEILTSYESITSTICVNYVLRANFQNRKCFNLVTYTNTNAESLSLKYTKDRKKNIMRGNNLTVSDNRVIFSLSKHNNPLSLCVDFGQSLGFLDNFLNVLGLQPIHTEFSE